MGGSLTRLLLHGARGAEIRNDEDDQRWVDVLGFVGADGKGSHIP